MREMNRRKFLKLASGAALAAAGGCLPHVEGDWQSCTEAEPQLPPLPSVRVVEVFAEGAVMEAEGKIVPEVVAEMFRAGLCALTEKGTLVEAWAVVLPGWQTGQKISLKVNALNPGVPTSPTLVGAAVGSLLRDFGAPAADVFVWDRSRRDLEQAGIVDDRVGGACRGTYQSASDPTGPGYEEEPACLSGRKIYLSRLLTRETQHLLNLAVMKNHFAAKFTGCLKNHYGSFSRPWDFHQESDQHIARLNSLQEITRVARLFVLDALLGVCLGDTDKPADCAPKRLLFSFDPVAIDTRGVEIRDEMRATVHGQQPGAQPGYLAEAESLGLGSTAYRLVPISL